MVRAAFPSSPDTHRLAVPLAVPRLAHVLLAAHTEVLNGLAYTPQGTVHVLRVGAFRLVVKYTVGGEGVTHTYTCPPPRPAMLMQQKLNKYTQCLPCSTQNILR